MTDKLWVQSGNVKPSHTACVDHQRSLHPQGAYQKRGGKGAPDPVLDVLLAGKCSSQTSNTKGLHSDDSRTRHVKCDQTKPSCTRCIETGRSCDGYSVQQSDRQLDISSYAIPFQVPGSQLDRHLLHYFCIKGAVDLSGYMSFEFWTRIILQRSHDQVAVRQAVIALSSLHLSEKTKFEGPHGEDSICEEPILLYNKALRSLRRYLNAGAALTERVSPAVALICCALFYCFEGARGNTNAALRHLQSGLMILKVERAKESGSGRSQMESIADSENIILLEQLFYRLDLQATMFDDARKPLLPFTPARTTADGLNTSLGNLSTVDEAQEALTNLQNWALSFLISNEEMKFWSKQDLPHHIVLEKQQIAENCTRWTREFEILRQKLDLYQPEEHGHSSHQYILSLSHATNNSHFKPIEPIQNPAFALLRIHYLILRLLLDSSLPYDPTVFVTSASTEHRSAIDAILDLATSLLSSDSDGSVPQVSSPTISAEAGIIPPLFLLAMKSGDPIVVKRALALLTASNRREGLYDSKIVVGIAERIMVLEKERHEDKASADSTDAMDGPLEYRCLDAIDDREGGITGIAKNLGVLT